MDLIVMTVVGVVLGAVLFKRTIKIHITHEHVADKFDFKSAVEDGIKEDPKADLEYGDMLKNVENVYADIQKEFLGLDGR